jgi:hypothetical protein
MFSRHFNLKKFSRKTTNFLMFDCQSENVFQKTFFAGRGSSVGVGIGVKGGGVWGM